MYSLRDAEPLENHLMTYMPRDSPSSPPASYLGLAKSQKEQSEKDERTRLLKRHGVLLVGSVDTWRPTFQAYVPLCGTADRRA